MTSKLIFACLLSAITVCQARDPFPDLTDDTFQTDCLSKSNDYRSKHNDTQALILDSMPVNYAKSRCSVVSQYERLSNGHSGLVGFGENLFWAGIPTDHIFECSVAIEQWYGEIENYDYGAPGYSVDTDKFTQLVWKSTLFIGCARCGGEGTQWNETYIVCNFFPAGNVAGTTSFEENVLPLIE